MVCWTKGVNPVIILTQQINLSLILVELWIKKVLSNSIDRIFQEALNN